MAATPAMIENHIDKRWEVLATDMEKEMCDICDLYVEDERNPAFVGRALAPKVVWKDMRPKMVGDFASLPPVGRQTALLAEKLKEIEALTRSRLAKTDDEGSAHAIASVKPREWQLRYENCQAKGQVGEAIGTVDGEGGSFAEKLRAQSDVDAIKPAQLSEVVALAQLGAEARRTTERMNKSHASRRRRSYNQWLEEQGRVGYGVLHGLTKPEVNTDLITVGVAQGNASANLQDRVDHEQASWAKIWRRHEGKASKQCQSQ